MYAQNAHPTYLNSMAQDALLAPCLPIGTLPLEIVQLALVAEYMLWKLQVVHVLQLTLSIMVTHAYSATIHSILILLVLPA
jgi:hypothetical protein